MKINELKKEGLRYEYEVVVPAKDMDARLESRLKDVAESTKVPGFRPGKVPLSIVKKKHGARVLGEVLENAVSESYRDLLKKNKLRPAVDPQIEIDKAFDEGKDLKYSVVVEVFPDVPDVDFSKVKLEQLAVEVGDKEIEEGLGKLKEANKEFKALATARAAKKGDTTVIDFVGKIDGEAFEGGAGQDHHLILGSNQFIPGFEDQLIGAKKGDKKAVKVTFPEDYGHKDFAGKDAVFDVEVKDILEPKEPKIDAEFAKKLSFDSVDKLREAIKERIEKDYEAACRMLTKKSLFDALNDLYDFEVPSAMLEQESTALRQHDQEEHEHGEECDHGKECDKEKKKPSKKELEKFEKLALRRVRLGLVLAELSQKNKITVTETELRRVILDRAANFPGQEQQIIEIYQKNPQLLDQTRGPILEDKVVDFLFEKIKPKEKKISVKEFEELQKKAEAELE